MGILNLTPDSFSDGGRFDTFDKARLHVANMINEGAGIIDIGAYSSRPGAKDIEPKEERSRLIPALRVIRKEHPSAILSIDTFRSEVADAALNEGADMINDISGGNLDGEMIATLAKWQCPYVAMHMSGTPQSMQDDIVEGHVTHQLLRYFHDIMLRLNASGLSDVIIDPGFGFGKSLRQNYGLAKDLRAIKSLGMPLLIGVSRKSMVNRVAGTRPETALNASTALHMALLCNGADIIRTHDVAEAKECIAIYEAMQSGF
jgi:dihydropteroate synthase